MARVKYYDPESGTWKYADTASGSDSGDSVQPDLAQNDSTQPDYVKNRTHWEENNQTVIEWDGSTEGKDSFLIYDGTVTLCKVSDVVPDVAELNGNIAIVAGIGEFPLSEEMFSQSSWGYSAEVIFGIKNTTFEWDGATYTAPSTGLYFMSQNGAYVSSLTYGSVTVHQLDEKFIPDTIARTVDIPTDAHINELINTALGVIENGSY